MQVIIELILNIVSSISFLYISSTLAVHITAWHFLTAFNQQHSTLMHLNNRYFHAQIEWLHSEWNKWWNSPERKWIPFKYEYHHNNHNYNLFLFMLWVLWHFIIIFFYVVMHTIYIYVHMLSNKLFHYIYVLLFKFNELAYCTWEHICTQIHETSRGDELQTPRPSMYSNNFNNFLIGFQSRMRIRVCVCYYYYYYTVMAYVNHHRTKVHLGGIIKMWIWFVFPLLCWL